jgi:heme A synthase
MFVFEIEWDVLFGDHDKKDSFMHPAIALPFIGQLLLLFTLFQKTPNRKLTITGIILMGLLVLLLLLIGILGLNFKIIASVIPFIGLSVFYFIKEKGTKVK